MRAGEKAPPETLQRMREAMKKLWADPAYRERMSLERRGRKHSADTKQRMSEGQKKAYVRRDSGLCEGCLKGDCLLCDGGACRCTCALELDRKRVRR